jgi:hypothetical protein
MTCAYMPDGCTYNGVQNVLPQAYVEQISVGDVLEDDWLNPLVWHKDTTRVLSRERILHVYQHRL